MSNEEIKKYLRDNADPAYGEFHRRLVPGTDDIIGVRLPVIRALAKEIAKGDWRGYLAAGTIDTYEEKMLRGLVIGQARVSFEELEPHIRAFVPLIDNWAVCDCFNSGLKITKKNKAAMWRLINDYLNSEKEFELRFAVVMMMEYYLDGDEYIDEILSIYDSVRSDGYYVKMGVAWGLSFCFIKHRDKTLEYFRGNSLDKWTHNRAIQKTRESFRVTPEDKELLKTLKK